MHSGTVLFFNRLQGFGFIVPSLGGDDVFFHYSQIAIPGVRRLEKGQVVKYDVGPNPRKAGTMAVNITPVVENGGSDEHNR